MNETNSTTRWRWVAIFVLTALAAYAVTVLVTRSRGSDLSARDAIAKEVIRAESPDRGLHQLVVDFDDAWLGTVVAVGEPQWNSADNRDWDDSESEFTAALVFTPVEFEVTSVVWTNAQTAARIQPGQKIEVWFVGDPSVGKSNPAAQNDGLEVGSERLVFSFTAPLPYREGYTEPRNRSELVTAVWAVGDEQIWPHSHLQAKQIRALSDAGVTERWQPDPRGEDFAVTSISLEALADLLHRMELEDPVVLQTTSRVDPTRALQAVDPAGPGGPDESDLRAAAIEDTVVTPLRSVLDITSANLELDANGVAPPVLTIVVQSRASTDIGAVADAVGRLQASEKVQIVLTSDDDGVFANFETK